MEKRRIRKLCPALVAIALASTALLISVQPSSASSALFRAKRTWWFSQVGSWTDGKVIPPSGKLSYQPPAVAYVGNTYPVRGFTAPKSFIKDTTYHFGCPSLGCSFSYPESSGWYSYWNAKGSFRANNPNAPTTTTTVRMRTTADGYDPSLMGWPTVMRTRTIWPHETLTLATPPPTAMGDPLTPTTTWGGRYDHSRGGSIMIWPGKNRFGGTMRFFEGPNSRYYAYLHDGRPGYPYPYTSTLPAKPLSKQIGTGAEFSIGEVTEAYVAFKFRVTIPGRDRVVIGTTSMGGPQYAVRTAHYLVTRAPYTTGMAQAWQPNGNTNTIQTATGYDNRTPAGLNGTISLVHPRLVHAYTVFPPSSGKPIKLSWSSARMRKIDFRFLPEPAGSVLLVSGLAMLAGVYRLRRR